MTSVAHLAEAAGLQTVWQDADGVRRTVADEALIAILSALGHPAETENDRKGSAARITANAARVPAFLSADIGEAFTLPVGLGSVSASELCLEDGTTREVIAEGGRFPGIHIPGYHRLRIGAHERTLAIAPPACPRPARLSGRSIWGAAIQIPSLREHANSAFGTLDDLVGAIRALARRGADAVAISPIHAPLAGAAHFAPYMPSSRLFLNPDLSGPAPPGPKASLIDWAEALPFAAEERRAAYAALPVAERERWATLVDQDENLFRHAVFDALSLHFGKRDWRDWPKAFRDPAGQEVRAFARSHRDDVALHAWAQGRVHDSLRSAHRAAHDAGMALGLISDLAVGVDPGGSDAWSMQDAMLTGLSIGAPPDPLGPQGQNWGLTGFSPEGLRACGFAPFIAMLRTALSHAGGLRIDHGFGLQRLWVIPEGGSAGDGAYLTYPFADLLRIVTIEANRSGALMIAEDLGTRPPGYAQALAARQIAGMRVLWFERDERGRFRRPEDFPPDDIAMTGTHDTATIAGWWSGRDIAWRQRLDQAGPEAKDERARDRLLLWDAIGEGDPLPLSDDPAPVVEATLRHLGRSASSIAIVPLEDLFGIEEQPNLPGTIDEHPNWRRRLPGPLDTLLDAPATVAAVDAINEGRMR